MTTDIRSQKFSTGQRDMQDHSRGQEYEEQQEEARRKRDQKQVELIEAKSKVEEEGFEVFFENMENKTERQELLT